MRDTPTSQALPPLFATPTASAEMFTTSGPRSKPSSRSSKPSSSASRLANQCAHQRARRRRARAEAQHRAAQGRRQRPSQADDAVPGRWDENRAKLAANHDLEDLRAMNYCDKLTLLYTRRSTMAGCSTPAWRPSKKKTITCILRVCNVCCPCCV